MAWTTMHFAVGMGCTGAAVGAACLTMRRGWRWLPAAVRRLEASAPTLEGRPFRETGTLAAPPGVPPVAAVDSGYIPRPARCRQRTGERIARPCSNFSAAEGARSGRVCWPQPAGVSVT